MRIINLFLTITMTLIFLNCTVENDNILLEGCTSPIENSIPVIIIITPDSGEIGGEVTLAGKVFGATQGTNKVSFTGAEATEYTSWSDTEIKVKVPTGTTTGKVWVTVDGQMSNEVDFTLNANDPTEVQICDQIWMVKNLDVDHYRNGDPIPEVTDPDEWANLTTGAWCYYDNDPANGEVYGKLYNWHAVNDPRGLTPEGWHVPSDDEWKELEMCLGMSQAEADGEYWRGTDEGAQLAGRADLWKGGDLKNNANFGKSGFSASPGGFRWKTFYFEGVDGRWWSASESSSADAWTRTLYNSVASVYRNGSPKAYGYSVRLVRD